ncbi:MAG: DUF2079 domain-containing protein, partial [Coleofasciculaceae cyanobacterium]
RHALFQSGVFELGFYDQLVYLISQGQPPISSFLGIHFLGDHAAWAIYPLALLYKIYPSVYWLFAVQAIALTLGALPIFYLARQVGLKESLALAVAASYLLYPAIFNINLFDFHAEVMALPVLFGAILAAQRGYVGWFCLAIIFILGCKAVLSFTVAAMGLWLLLEKNRRLESTPRQQKTMACFALFAGVAWFLIATQVIIPNFAGHEPIAVSRYSYLGDSVLEIGKNLFLKPGLVFGKVFSFSTLEYLILLALPVILGLSFQGLTPLIAALPALALNIISESANQRNLVLHYSLPVVPFLFLVVIYALASRSKGLPQAKWLVLWSLISFLALAKYGYFGSIYLDSLPTLSAMREAVAQVPRQGRVLTTHEIAPHLSHRPLIEFTNLEKPPELKKFDYVLLNLPYPGWRSSPEFAASLVGQLQNMSEFKLTYQQDGVYLFVKRR